MLETPAVFTREFDDAGIFARALTQANVSCIQTNTGPIQLDLTICKSNRMELHFTSMPVGACIATGKTADATHSFHVPLQETALIAMAGLRMNDATFAAYGHGGEHAISARGGARLAYIVPSLELIEQASFVHLAGDAFERRTKLEVVSTTSETTARLRNFLQDVSSVVADTPHAISNPEVFRHIEQMLMEFLMAAYSSRREKAAATGRAPLSRLRILQKIDEFLQLKAADPVYVTDLCAAAGISQPTLFRIFADVFQVNPKRYLQLRRLHLAREKLQDGANPARSVSSIAFDCGFWQLGRFGQEYRKLFGEAPSQTLRRSRAAICS